MRIVLITGAARGIGFETAQHLAKTGYRVYAMVRSSSDTADLDILIKDLPIKKVVADVTDSCSIEDAVQAIIKNEGCIDVVINNACHVVVGTCETCTIDEQQESMNVNYFGAVRVLQSVLPHMRKKGSGQIIQISSVAGYEPFPHLESYVASKFALEGLTESLASHLVPWNIHISLVEPGGVKTEAPRQAPLGSRVLADTNTYEHYLKHAKQQMIQGYEQSMEPSEVVQVIDDILQSKNPHLRYPIGNFAKMRAQERFQDPTGDSYVAFKNQLLANSYLYNILGT
jgi:NAD(P)-dependent dehydrogenase (short-subunit alcohol dehydrogenase family)